MQQRQLEQQLRRRRHAKIAAWNAWQHPQVFLERLQDLVRIQLEVAHDLAEHVPFHLRKCQADVLVGQQGVVAASRFIECAIDDAFGRLGHLVLRNIEIFHGRLQGESRSDFGGRDPLPETAAKARPVIEDGRDGANRLKEERKSR